MAAPVQTIDFDSVFNDITERLEAEKTRRLLPPEVQLFDGDWNLRGTVHQAYSGSFQFVDNETGVGSLEMPLNYYLAQWAVDFDSRQTVNIHIAVNKDGARWSGRMERVEVIKEGNGKDYVRLLFKHDYEELKHILIWSNPFLPAEIQFPRLFVLFGRARWVCKTALQLNIMRLESSIWMLPDDPMDPAQWFNFDQSTWSMVVKPDLEPDHSVGAIFHSRFKNAHEATKNIVADAQLSWEFRRYLPGDEEPWPGADLKYGCLVIDLVDKSGWNTGTSFGGSVFDGLIKEFLNIGGDGLTTTTENVVDPNFPDLAFEPGWSGTVASAPAVIYRESPHTGIQSSSFYRGPASDVGAVGGGHSMPGVNELMSATVQMLGDLSAMIPGVPPLGGVADAVLRPIYTDTILAFAKWKNPARAQRLGSSHYHERWAEGADRAYTLSWLLAMRTAMWQTREYISHTITVADGAPWRIGQRGHGHSFLGDRVGSSLLGMTPGRVFVDRVSELTISWDRSTSPTWKIVIGARDPEDPVIKAYEKLQDVLSLVKDLGVM